MQAPVCFTRNRRVLCASAVLALISAACASAAPAPSGNSFAFDSAVGDAVDPGTLDVEQPDVALHARIFAHDPNTDKKLTAEVVLPAPTSQDGHLLGPFADVLNCLPEEGGAPLTDQGMTYGSTCHEIATVFPNADGSYLSYLPPDDYAAPDDSFAELQMYYHVHQMHAYFADGFDMHDVDFPIQSVVNFSMYIDPKVAGGSGQTGGWQGFPNALFMPPEGFAAYGLPKVANGAIIFGQYQDVDFSYDSSVIYHEYTHAMVGTTRLSTEGFDGYGMDNLPRAMNEGFADYFSSAAREDPHIGPYALAGLEKGIYQRDLSQSRKCPDDLFSEMHADGKIIGSAMWEIRGAIGGTEADGIILKALQKFTVDTSLAGAGQLIASTATSVDKTISAQVKKILNNHGIISCVRAKKWQAYDSATSPEQIAYSLTGEAMFGGKLPDGVPGYFQFYVDVPAGTKAVALRWRAGVDSQGDLLYDKQMKVALAISVGNPATLGMTDAKVKANVITAAVTDSTGPGWMRVTLANTCLPPMAGKVYLMFLNQGQNNLAIDKMQVDLLSSVPSDASVAVCGG